MDKFGGKIDGNMNAFKYQGQRKYGKWFIMCNQVSFFFYLFIFLQNQSGYELVKLWWLEWHRPV